MKKRILALLLALLFVFSTFVLSACGEEESAVGDPDEEKRATPVTLTLCVVADSYTEEARLSIQAALNEITREEYNTNVVLYIATKDEYQSFVSGKLDEAKDNLVVNPNKDALGMPIVDEGYPALKANQFDVLWVDGYEHMLELVKAGELSQLSLDKQKLIKQYIDPVALALAGMYELSTYAIPVRHLFGEYTYLLLNKEVVDEVGFDYSGVNSLEELLPYLEQAKELKLGAEEGSVFAGMNILQNMPEANYLQPTQALVKVADETSIQAVEGLLFGSNICFPLQNKKGEWLSTLTEANSVPSSLLTNSEYQDATIWGALLNEKGLLGTGDAVTDDTDCAAAFVKADSILVEDYKDKYYVIEYSTNPMASKASLGESMFAVSSHTAEADRSLELISALVTNSEICNLLAYGVEEEHYEIISEGDEDVVDFIVEGDGKYVETNVYKSKGLYCGNQFLTMPHEDMNSAERALAVNNWYEAADQDMAMAVNPYEYFYIDTTKKKATVSMADVLSAMQAVSKTVAENIAGFTSFAEFKANNAELIPDSDMLGAYIAAFRKFIAEDQLALFEADAKYADFAGKNVNLSLGGQYSSWYQKMKLDALADASK